MNTEALFEAIYKRLNDIRFNPVVDIPKAVFNSLPQSGRNIAATLGNLLAEIIPNVSPYINTQGCEEADRTSKGRAKCSEKALSDTAKVHTGNQVFQRRVEFGCKLTPIHGSQPISSFVKRPLEIVANRNTEQLIIKVAKEAANRIKHRSIATNNQSSESFKVDLSKSIVKRLSNTLTDILEIHGLHETVSRLDCSIEALTDLGSEFVPRHAVHRFIEFLTNEDTEFSPRTRLEQLFQSISEGSNLTVNGSFLEHGSIVGYTTSTTAAVGVKDIQLVKTGSKTLGVCRRLTDRVRILRSCFYSLGVGVSATQLCKELGQQVQEVCHLIGKEVDCRSKRINDRSNSRRQRVLHIKSIGSDHVQRLVEGRSNRLAVHIQVSDTGFQSSGDTTQDRADNAVHSNTLQGSHELVSSLESGTDRFRRIVEGIGNALGNRLSSGRANVLELRPYTRQDFLQASTDIGSFPHSSGSLFHSLSRTLEGIRFRGDSATRRIEGGIDGVILSSGSGNRSDCVCGLSQAAEIQIRNCL